MGIEKLKRVLWRLENKNPQNLMMTELRRAVMFECGTDRRTISDNIKRLVEVGWIKRKGRYTWIITQEGLDGSSI